MLSPVRHTARHHARAAARISAPPSPLASSSVTTTTSLAASRRRNFSRTEQNSRGRPQVSWSPSQFQNTSAGRQWPRQEIPADAKQVVYDAEKSNGGPIRIAWTDRFLFVEDAEDGAGRRALKPATLRDSCACAKCRDTASGQKTFGSIEIPADIGIAEVTPTEEGIAIKFDKEIPRFVEDGDHITVLPWQAVDMSLKRTYLENIQLPRKRSILQRTGVVFWDRDIIDQQVRKIDYEEYMRGEEAFWDVIIDLCRFGIVYLKNVPKDEESVINITARIANIRETFYGRTFDVRAKPNAENVAYTSGHLGLHQDLLYLDPPPMIQVLHCIENSSEGGESLFSDGERVGRLIWPFLASKRMQALATHHVPYQYDKNGFHYFSSRYVIDGNEGGFQGVYWSPPFQGKYISAAKDIRRWIEPAQIFDSLINDEKAIHKHKMEPGECVLFDNLRLMHGRTAFNPNADQSGRWLRGAYIAGEDFFSRAAHIPEGLAEKYRGEERWTSGFAQKELKNTDWHKGVWKKVRALDPDLPTM